MTIPVGKGGEKQVLKTIASYERVADEIASLCPDTIVITSPHATMYADYFHISPGSRAKGSFAMFGASNVRFSEEYDEDLADKICEIADTHDFPCGTLGEEKSELDHGTMVPLWFIRNKYKVLPATWMKTMTTKTTVMSTRKTKTPTRRVATPVTAATAAQ